MLKHGTPHTDCYGPKRKRGRRRDEEEEEEEEDMAVCIGRRRGRHAGGRRWRAMRW